MCNLGMPYNGYSATTRHTRAMVFTHTYHSRQQRIVVNSCNTRPIDSIAIYDHLLQLKGAMRFGTFKSIDFKKNWYVKVPVVPRSLML